MGILLIAEQLRTNRQIFTPTFSDIYVTNEGAGLLKSKGPSTVTILAHLFAH